MQGGGAAGQKRLPGPRLEGGGGSYPRGGATLARDEHTARALPHCPRSRSALPAHPATAAPAGTRRTTGQRFKMSVAPSRLPNSSGWTTALPGLLEVTRARSIRLRPLWARGGRGYLSRPVGRGPSRAENWSLTRGAPVPLHHSRASRVEHTGVILVW